MDQGAVQGPEEFAEGLVIGVRSLFGHTVGAYDFCVHMYVIITLKCIVFGKQVVICSKREFPFLLISLNAHFLSFTWDVTLKWPPGFLVFIGWVGVL